MAANAADARGGAADGAAGVGQDRQRLLLLGQASVKPERRLLGRQVRAAVAVACVRRPLRGATGCSINAVAPGPVAGELWHAPGGLADQRATSTGQTRQQVLDAVASRIPTGRYSSEQEIADVIVFLCSERASNVSGAAWSADGGAVPVII